MNALVIFIVLVIIVLQFFFFFKNVSLMHKYKSIFEKYNTWGVEKNLETDFVEGIYGDGNEVFRSIKITINNYLSNNSGSIIQFNLLKDTVDRHCDSVENDVNTLTPVPLYCGLAGTMVGIIIGLGSLIGNDAISSLLKSGSSITSAADGINDLLLGVAWSMVASFCGILLTTISSILFKKYKLTGEIAKNNFLSWLQAELLPKLPSDTSQVFNNLVANLNKLNYTFAANTTELNGVLTKVNDSYQIQADIIQTIHQMDVMKMAMANVNVLKSLDECTKKLETFNAYLNGVETCIASFEKFKQLFDKEAERTQVLEEIRYFFTRHKGEIAKSVTDADVELREALLTVKQTSIDGSYELQKVLIEQSEDFKQISQLISEEFTNQLKLAPQMQKQLAEISQIPAKLDKLIDKIEKSNSDLAKNVANTMKATAQEISGSSSGEISNNGKSARYNRNVFIVMLAFAILMAIVVIFLDFRYNL